MSRVTRTAWPLDVLTNDTVRSGYDESMRKELEALAFANEQFANAKKFAYAAVAGLLGALFPAYRAPLVICASLLAGLSAWNVAGAHWSLAVYSNESLRARSNLIVGCTLKVLEHLDDVKAT